VRCQVDETGTWHLICPGTCWKRASGGVVDGDNAEAHKWYRYGGMWKNKHDAVSAKMKKRKPENAPRNRAQQELSAAESELKMPNGDGRGSSSELDVHQDSLYPAWVGSGTQYTKDDQITWHHQTWSCRQSHVSTETRTPDKTVSLWKKV